MARDLGSTTPFFKTSFAAGEITPGLWARVDLDRYQLGAQLLKNFVVDYKGGAFNRAGTEFVGEAATDDVDEVRLIPFRFSQSQQYIIELTTTTIRVIWNGGFVLDSSSVVALSG